VVIDASETDHEGGTRLDCGEPSTFEIKKERKKSTFHPPPLHNYGYHSISESAPRQIISLQHEVADRTFLGPFACL